MNKFQNRFFHHIHEQDNEREAMEASLDKDTNPEDFDVDNVPVENEYADATRKAAQAAAAQTIEMVAQMNQWTDECTRFISYLNGEDPNSITKVLGRAEPKTIMDVIKSKSAGDLAAIAGDLSSFVQNLRSQIALAPTSTQLAGI
jgi:hypothetical protein